MMTQEEWDTLTEEEQHEVREVRPWDLIDPSQPKVHKDVKKYRYDTCKGCEAFNKLTRSCKECGCFMALKTTLANAYCPLGKWGIVEQEELLWVGEKPTENEDFVVK